MNRLHVHSRIRTGAIISAVIALSPLVAIAASTSASAVGGAAIHRVAQGLASGLFISPIGQTGTYFTLTLSPSSTHHYSVNLANVGTMAEKYRTYAADVYTEPGGGLGANLRGQPRTGTTSWLSYPTAVGTLEGGHSLLRAFAVHVPTGTTPGQYVTSLVVENADPAPVGTTAGLKQIVRTVIAVSIRIPGALSGAFNIGSATISNATGHSVISISLANTGNARLKPVGTLRILNQNNAVVSSEHIVMGSFYAHTTTTVEASFATVLPKGQYTSQLVLLDPSTGITVTGDAPTVRVGPVPPLSAMHRIMLFTLITFAILLMLAGLIQARFFCRRDRPQSPRRRSHEALPPSSFPSLPQNGPTS